MDITRASPLLGGLSPRAFMRLHWQKSPLVIRQAVMPDAALPDRRAMFELAARDAVESRLVVREGERWSVRSGPLPRRALPPIGTRRWTLLVQGVDLHVESVHELLQRFRFVPDARVDDVMLSYASDGGGVGPHVDSYDVFLLQLAGSRRWRVGPVADPTLRADVPLKVLEHFEPAEEWLLGPGDMLYLPPGWGHDGVAEGECITCSIGFRAPRRDELAGDLLQCMLDTLDVDESGPPYRDRGQSATDEPARVPLRLQRFADVAVARAFGSPEARACALGEVLSEPKPGVVFDAGSSFSNVGDVRLDRRSRMLYDDWHVFLNGESFRAGGSDAMLMRRLADRRFLASHELKLLGRAARELLAQWKDQGWLRFETPASKETENGS